MPSCFPFKAIRAGLTTEEVAAVRRISPHSVTEIRRLTASRESLLDIPVFTGEWPASRDTVVAIKPAHQWLQLLKEIADPMDKQAELEAGG